MTDMLNQVSFGDPTENSVLVIAHGLFGSARNWRVIAKKLSHDRQVITVDMRNHGDSFWSGSHSYTDMAQDLLNVVQNIDGPVDLMGHSMGGKAAMLAALQDPDAFDRLFVVDIAPVAYAHSHSGNINAMQNLALGSIARRSDADALLKSDISDSATRAFLLQSLNFENATASWKLNLPVLATYMPQIVGFPEVSGQYDGASYFLRGGKSDFVLPQHHDRIRSLFPRARIETIDPAGHWVHAEAPNEFLQTLIQLLED